MKAVATGVRRTALVMAVALVGPIGVVASAAPSAAVLPACTKTWTAATSGSWDTGAGWSGGTVPGPTDHVCITTAGTYTVTIPDPGDPVTVASLTVGATAGAGTQTLVVERGVASDATALLATQGIEITTRGAVELGDSDLAQVSIGVGDGAVVANAGRLSQVTGQTDSQIIRGDVASTGTLRLDEALFVEGDLTTEGSLQVNHVLHVDGTVWTKGGTITGEWVVVAHDGLRVGDAVIGVPGARPVFSVDGGELAFESEQPIDITVRNIVTVEGDTHPHQDIKVQGIEGVDAILGFTGTWTNGGTLALEPGEEAGAAVAGLGPDPMLVNEGDLSRFSEAGTEVTIGADVLNQGIIDIRDGFVEVTGDLRNDSSIDLRHGELAVGGDLDLPLGSVLHHHQRGGDDPDAGRLSVDGTAAVDGILIEHTDDDAVPAVGATATVVDAATRTGTFREIFFWGPASYDAQYTGTRVNLVRRASETTTRRFVRAAFQDFLGRQPSPEELADHAARIDDGVVTRATFVRGLSRSPQYVTALVQRFYADTLGRPGDPDGVAFWVEQLRTGRWTVAEVAGSFYASKEYFDRAGGTDAEWIRTLYGTFFNRLPSEGDLTYWATRIDQQGRTRVAIELFQSLESRRRRVERLYRDLLDRPGDAGGVDYWAARLTREGDLVLAVFLAASGEYLDRAEERYP